MYRNSELSESWEDSTSQGSHQSHRFPNELGTGKTHISAVRRVTGITSVLWKEMNTGMLVSTVACVAHSKDNC